MYSGPQLTMVADNTPPGSNTAQVVAADLAKIGFNVKTISVTHSTMYTRFCNVPKNEPNVCPNVGWLPGLPRRADHPRRHVQRQAASCPSTTRTGRCSNDPKINAEMARAERIVDPAARDAGLGQDRPAGHPDRRGDAVALGELAVALLQARDARSRALERRRARTSRSWRLPRPRPWRRGRPPIPPSPATLQRGTGRAADRRRRARGRRLVIVVALRRCAGILWGACMLLVVSALTFLIFYAFPSADPAALRAGRQATPRAHRADPARHSDSTSPSTSSSGAS